MKTYQERLDELAHDLIEEIQLSPRWLNFATAYSGARLKALGYSTPVGAGRYRSAEELEIINKVEMELLRSLVRAMMEEVAEANAFDLPIGD